MHLRFRHLVASLTVAAAGLAATAAVPASAATTVTLDHGHADVGVAYENDALDLHVHDEAGGEYEPSEVRLVAKSEARTTVPDDPAFGFLGDPGDPVWVLPEVEDPALLFLGLSAEEIATGVFANDTIHLDVVKVYGPGDFSVFTTDPAGAPDVLADSGDGLPDRIDLTAAGHAHANWAFEAAGTYKVVVKASGTLAGSGETVRSSLATYRFEVQP